MCDPDEAQAVVDVLAMRAPSATAVVLDLRDIRDLRAGLNMLSEYDTSATDDKLARAQRRLEERGYRV